MSNLNVFVGRQPIFDQSGNIYAYELLYRNSEENNFPNINPEKATIELLINTFLTIGIDQVVGRTRSFINFSEKLLKHDVIKQLNPKVVVIEILEDAEITPYFIKQLSGLKKAGFKLVLDDFVLHPKYDLHPELYKLINIIKVDFMNTILTERTRIETLVKNYPHISLLAEKVETEEQYEEAKQLGYLLFQGYFFARPEIIKSPDIPSNYALHLHLFQRLNEEVADIDEITHLIMRDVSLSYKLLRYINSLAFGVPNKISSIKQAIMLMGLNKARKWMQILLLHDIGTGVGKGREKALIDHSLIRAKVCEQLAKKKGKQNSEAFFLVGMFSLINIIMQRSWEDILPQLSLSKEITETLLGKETEMLPYIKLCKALEKFNWELIEKYCVEIGITKAELRTISTAAHHWVTHFD